MSIHENPHDHRGVFSELDRELQLAIRYLIWLGSVISAALLVKTILFF